MRFVITLSVLLHASSACAQLVKVVAQGCTAGACFQDVGSGVVVGHLGRDPIVITAGHNLRDAMMKASKQCVTVDKLQAQVIAWNDTPGKDIGILRVPGLRQAAAAIRSEVPNGTRVTIAGYPKGNSLREWQASLIRPDRIDTVTSTGVSGGPVGQRGWICGILTHSNIVENYSRLTDAETCIRYVRTHCPGCVLKTWQPVSAPPRIINAPPPPVIDVPDREKTARITQLERDVAEIKRLIRAIPAGPPGPRGPAGKDGASASATRLERIEQQINQPTEVWLEIIDANGAVVSTVAKQSYPAGSPIRLQFDERLIRAMQAE